MDQDVVISVRQVSKKFRLFNSPKERLAEALHPFRKQFHREFWALKDVSFDIHRGEIVGILGRNGSGKSTLLQIICSVMQPTEGSVEVSGRVSALLELGAGFNPEFTGRENVLLNGSIMGISRKEMLQRLPVIEAFADIGDFFDQPVKTYSSGMFVRVAFAAAINVDPDILIVDEALAVGDVRFQYKCFKKFAEFQERGKTILLVTHNTDAVVRHCGNAVLLDGGKIVEIGPPKNIVDIYLELMFTGQLNSYSALPKRVEQAYAGYEIFHFKTEYFAVAQQLGQIDLTQESRDQLEGYQARGLVYVANSLEALKEILTSYSNLEPTEALIPPSTVQCGDAQEKIMEFLAEVAVKDRCQERKSYNPSEHRYGDRRGEILDYLLVADDVVEPTTVRSGARCAIYMKVRYNADIQWPMFGLAIKTVDGQVVHGTNTLMGGVKFLPVIRGQTIIVKFEWEAWLNTSDYFIDLGCAEVCEGEGLPLDRRYGAVHLVVVAQAEFSGYVDLRASIMEAHRTVLAPTSSGRLPDICI